MMPGLSGYEFFEALRKLGGEGAAVPVIVTSARGSMAQFFDAWAIVEFIPKPFEMSLFLKKIREIFSPHAAAHSSGEVASVPKTGDQRTVVLVGVSEFEMRKAKDFLEQNSCVVVQALDEGDAFKTCQKLKPDFILIEFWDNEARFDAANLHHALAADPITKQIPYAVFCNPALQNEAGKLSAQSIY